MSAFDLELENFSEELARADASSAPGKRAAPASATPPSADGSESSAPAALFGASHQCALTHTVPSHSDVGLDDALLEALLGPAAFSGPCESSAPARASASVCSPVRFGVVSSAAGLDGGPTPGAVRPAARRGGAVQPLGSPSAAAFVTPVPASSAGLLAHTSPAPDQPLVMVLVLVDPGGAGRVTVDVAPYPTSCGGDLSVGSSLAGTSSSSPSETSSGAGRGTAPSPASDTGVADMEVGAMEWEATPPPSQCASGRSTPGAPSAVAEAYFLCSARLGLQGGGTVTPRSGGGRVVLLLVPARWSISAARYAAVARPPT